jgi:hypothetical protein
VDGLRGFVGLNGGILNFLNNFGILGIHKIFNDFHSRKGNSKFEIFVTQRKEGERDGEDFAMRHMKNL